MALIKCPECREPNVSDKAAACPRCGHPISLAAGPSGYHIHRSEIDLSHKQKGNFNEAFGRELGTEMGRVASGFAKFFINIAWAAIVVGIIIFITYLQHPERFDRQVNRLRPPVIPSLRPPRLVPDDEADQPHDQAQHQAGDVQKVDPHVPPLDRDTPKVDPPEPMVK